ncbi:MAG TPA: site-specific integrase [Bacteroidia bacterium]|nr:site-specific integrase [Bacteroidia bacterium]
MVVSVSIKAILRTDKQIKLNGKYPIYYLVRLDDKQIKIPAKKEAEKIYWDKVSGRLQKNAPDASILNDALAKCEQDFKDFILKNEMNGKAVAADEIKRHFNGSRSISFYDFYLEVVKVKKLKPNTVKVYNTTYTVLKQFRANIAFHELTPLFIKQFNHFLITVRGNSSGATFNRHKILKCIILEAIKNDLMEKNPYVGFPIRRVSSKKVFLNINEVEKLEKVNISDKQKHLIKIRDMFLFSCYTGIRFSDVLDLGWANITEDSIEFKMNKTGKFISIPLINKSKAILERYQNKKNVYVFPIISNQKANKGLKILAELAEINKHLTFHIARGTFATCLLAKDVQLSNIRDLLGHSNLRETEIYAKTNRDNIISSIRLLD